MSKGFLSVPTQDGYQVYLRADQVESVIEDTNGSRVRTRRTVYHLSEEPLAVLDLLGKGLNPPDEQGYFSSEPCI
jgi:hypothetical protein